MNRLLLAAALAVPLSLLSSAPPVGAQGPATEPPPLEAGVRVRVTDPALGPGPRAGLVAGVSGDRLAVYFARRSSPDTLLLSGVERIEVSRGFGPPRRLRGAARGAGAGVALGAALAVLTQAFGGFGGYGIDFALLAFVPPAAGLGVAAGALSARPEEVWEPLRPGAGAAARP